MRCILLFIFSFFILFGCHSDPSDPLNPDPNIPVDTTGQYQISQIKGAYKGPCYNHHVSFGSYDYWDTTYNNTILIDSLERIRIDSQYIYRMTRGLFRYNIPEADFVMDSFSVSGFGPSQTYSGEFDFIRSQHYLHSFSGQYPGFGFIETHCYCYKQ